MTYDKIPYLERLRADLVTGIARQRARRARRRRLGVAGAAVLVAAAVPLAGALDRGRGSAALAITKTPRWLELRIADATAGPERMTRELREAGVPGEVRVVPVSRSLVGRWAALETQPSPSRERLDPGTRELLERHDRELRHKRRLLNARERAEVERLHRRDRERDRVDVRRLNSIQFRPDVIRIPLSIREGFTGRLLLFAGRGPRNDELYAESGSAFESGEPLHCTGIERLSPAEAGRAIMALGYRVVWADPAPRRGRAPVGKILGARFFTTRDGQPRSRNEILVTVSKARLKPRIPPQRCSR